jgi:hypothetical protein
MPAMQSPLSRLGLESRHLLFIVSLGSLLIFTNLIKTDAISHPQRNLEFAANSKAVDQLKAGWGDNIARVQQAIYWDFGYLLSYALLLSLGCTFAADGPFRRGWLTRALGLLLAWGSLLAAAADVGANVAMLRMLRQQSVLDSTLVAAKIFASIEFSLAGFAVIYILAAILLSLLGQSATSAVSDG